MTTIKIRLILMSLINDDDFIMDNVEMTVLDDVKMNYEDGFDDIDDDLL